MFCMKNKTNACCLHFRLYALNVTSGNLLATYKLKGTDNCDWEDMAIGPGPGGINYIYIGGLISAYYMTYFMWILRDMGIMPN